MAIIEISYLLYYYIIRKRYLLRCNNFILFALIVELRIATACHKIKQNDESMYIVKRKGKIMFNICFGSIGLGIISSLLFTLLFVNFDATWKKTLTTLFSTCIGGTGIWGIFKTTQTEDTSIVWLSIGIFAITFTIVYVLLMLVLCKLLKDNDRRNVLRIRDIILGQKKYIDIYYDQRIDEIKQNLNYDYLKQLETDIKLREARCIKQAEQLESEREELNNITDGKLRIKLPESKNLAVTEEFLNLFPSYVDCFSSFAEGIKKETDLFLSEYDKISINDFKIYLTIISIQILEHLFGKYAKDVRVHFRFYDQKRKGYAKLISIISGKPSLRDLTFIPYDQANMILKSFECKRALIKSHNLKYDFAGNNNTIWTEYITGTFYNIQINKIPCLSFGISVKNSTKYKHLFNFLNFCKFESYIQEEIERIDERFNIISVLYGND